MRPTEDRIDLAASVPEPFEGDLRLEPCQRRAQAEVDALAEGGMRARVTSKRSASGNARSSRFAEPISRASRTSAGIRGLQI